MEHEEYTAETYPCSGKKYNGEKAIISLTSWKARINTVSKTLYSLIKQCPGFHIVLVLSEEEFPKKEAELPESLMLFVENNLIEVLWVYKNYKSLKKVLFTMDKYRTVPVISSDDDIIYKINYAKILYDYWYSHKDTLVTLNNAYANRTSGAFTLYFPNCFRTNSVDEIHNNKHVNEYLCADDAFYEMLRAKYNRNIKIYNFHMDNSKSCSFVNSIQPLSYIYSQPGFLEKIRKIQSKDCGFNINDMLGKDK